MPWPRGARPFHDAPDDDNVVKISGVCRPTDGLAVSLVVLALSGPSVRLNASDLNIVILLDRSDSITASQRANEVQWVAETLARKGADDRIAVVGFAADAVIERPLGTDATPPVYSEDATLQPTRTDIANAIQLALARACRRMPCGASC